ncbi:MAG TPA: hypothetical protein PLM53_14575 [Spirochaetota bacterium]|nr:hypothetical protein [Spirochaetota bacterium]HPC41898.1 hypothetical protein [Spirochaetota bacterium]HPL17172.1 hypothetical protein [Spirochaetota bacterium]HQF09609.1 hypothetical protein [Spirochaetota bacterium]HQH98321.1 hypothetical protein [Spirochaetota bacterium]
MDEKGSSQEQKTITLPSEKIVNRPEILMGTSGWHYDDWKGLFYPEKLGRNNDPCGYAVKNADTLNKILAG